VESKRSGFKSTLSLISIIKYSKTYQMLKEKYKDMIKVWPEVTDPEKFVYEDVAIAAYLLILWEEERAERGLTAKQSFVDLGCGNGLLVHILSTEGHPGRGIDVRRRKIWDTYGPQTCLEEGAITPNDKNLFPDVDWLIGNHSDELTPWIPVIAARSSYGCRFFVLPCCFFDFTGKYSRRQSRKTQYREYLDFIMEVGLACGFHVEEDCLRIPSTKRVRPGRRGLTVLGEVLASGWGAEGCVTEPQGTLVFNTGCDPGAACADLSVSAMGGVRRARFAPTAPPVAAFQDPRRVFIFFPETARGPRGPVQSGRQSDLCSSGPSIV